MLDDEVCVIAKFHFLIVTKIKVAGLYLNVAAGASALAQCRYLRASNGLPC